MSPIVFEKGIIVCTYLVSFEAMDLVELQRPPERDTQDEVDEAEWIEPEPEEDRKIPTLEEEPRLWAWVAVYKVLNRIITRTRPQKVEVTIRERRQEADVSHVAALRQQIERGEKSGRLVTAHIEISRPDRSHPYLTRPELLTFPGTSWFTHQLHDEPGNGLTLLHLSIDQVPDTATSRGDCPEPTESV